MTTRRYRRTVTLRSKGWPNYAVGYEKLRRTRVYDIEVKDLTPKPRKPHEPKQPKLPKVAAPSYDLQLRLSRCNTTETWVTLMQRVRDGSPVAYDLYVYAPGDFVWNFVGTWPEYRPALAAKDWWVEYAEQGGTYQTWLASEVLNAN